MILRELLATFGLKFDKASFTQADAAVNALKGAAMKLAAVVATGLVANEIKNIVKETIALGDHIDDLSVKLGINQEALQEIEFAAKRSGIELEALDKSLTVMTRTAADAAAGEESASKKFAEFGIKVRDANGHIKQGDVLISDIADAMEKARDPAQKLRIATSFFGERGGSRFVLFLKDGKKGLDALRQEARELGGVMDAELAQALGETDDLFVNFNFAVRGLKNTLTAALLPVLKEVIGGFILWIKANRELLKQRVTTYVQQFIRALVIVFGIMQRGLNVLRWLVDLVGGLERAVIGLSIALGVALLAKLGLAIASLGAFSAASIGATLAGIALPVLVGAAFLALVGIILLIVEEIKALFSPTQGLFELMQGKWGELRKRLFESMKAEDNPLLFILKNAGVLVVFIIEMVDNLFNALFHGLNILMEFNQALVDFLTAIPEMAKAAGQAIINAFKEALNTSKVLFASFLEANPLFQLAARTFNAGAQLIGSEQRISTTPANDALLARRDASFAPSVNVSVDASGQQLNEGQVAGMVRRQVDEALTQANADALRALTPSVP